MGIIIRPSQGGSGGSGGGIGNIGISKDQFLATEGQTAFTISEEVTLTDLLMVYVNNLYLEQNINYSIIGTTVTVPPLKTNDVVSWALIKVGEPIVPTQKEVLIKQYERDIIKDKF